MNTMSSEAAPLNSDYVSALGLQQDPFVNDLADHFFYADPGLMQRLDLLQHLIQFGDQLLLVTGPEGSGKTTLLRQFRLRAKDSWQICRLDAAQVLTGGHLLHELADFFGTPYGDDNPALAREIVQQTRTLQQEAGLAVVIIDAAEQLSDDCLTTLLTLTDPPQEALRFLRILLLAEDGLDERLLTLGLNNPRAPLVHRLAMQPFDTQQSAAYLMYRLAIAGYSGDSPFSGTEVEAMHKAAAGWPGRLNDYARETLIETINRKAVADKTRKKTRASPSQSTPGRRFPPLPVKPLVGGVAIVAVVTVLAWLIFGLSGDDNPDRLELRPLTLPGEITPVPADNRQAETSTPATGTIARPVPGEDMASQPPVPTVQLAPFPPAAEQTAQATAGDLSTTVPESPSPGIPEPQPEPAPTAAEPVTAPSEASATPPPPPPVAETPPKSPSATAEPAKTPVAPAPRPPSPLPDWVNSAPGEHYTLQLVGLSKKSSANDYVKTHKLTGKVAIITSERNGAPWYSVIYGDYRDKNSAKTATLPASLKNVDPWPRSFQSVREAAGLE